ncbi:hypothetical protein I5E68_02140 [Novosphingobium sp. YJ-S2-02]|uniref:Uncharacterized protein n=1 Tax=Novosphingobium aureum TaxID=2792964 RepID=A0A931H9C8_9SPHN|nr:hypothetical protein [Novosphingobium aureum]MBH0111750.1 hypothetical protein [Novosphingobium aureum]
MTRFPPLTAAIATLALPLALAACSSAGQFPSLAMRDFERTGQFEPVRGEDEATSGGEDATGSPLDNTAFADGELDARLEALLASARKANARFEADRPSAERAVARAGSVSSDSWAAAQIAVSDLETSRSTAMTALADLDRLYADSRDAAPLEISPQTEAIAEARGQVANWVSAQDAVLVALAAKLRG